MEKLSILRYKQRQNPIVKCYKLCYNVKCRIYDVEERGSEIGYGKYRLQI